MGLFNKTMKKLIPEWILNNTDVAEVNEVAETAKKKRAGFFKKLLDNKLVDQFTGDKK